MNQSPVNYLESAVIAREVGEELLSRLDWMTINPAVILEVGCGPGGLLSELHRRYPAARLIASDHSASMIQHVRETSPYCETLLADAAELPLPTKSVDVLIANLLLPWHHDVTRLFKEWHRVLRPNGLLMLSALGPESMAEWQTLFQRYDMHDLGDAMVQAGFAEPVLDVNHYTLTYRETETLCRELRASEMIAEEQAFPESLAPIEGRWEVLFESIIAHAFIPPETDLHAPQADGTVRVPITALREKLRRVDG